MGHPDDGKTANTTQSDKSAPDRSLAADRQKPEKPAQLKTSLGQKPLAAAGVSPHAKPSTPARKPSRPPLKDDATRNVLAQLKALSEPDPNGSDDTSATKDQQASKTPANGESETANKKAGLLGRLKELAPKQTSQPRPAPPPLPPKLALTPTDRTRPLGRVTLPKVDKPRVAEPASMPAVSQPLSEKEFMQIASVRLALEPDARLSVDDEPRQMRPAREVSEASEAREASIASQRSPLFPTEHRTQALDASPLGTSKVHDIPGEAPRSGYPMPYKSASETTPETHAQSYVLPIIPAPRIELTTASIKTDTSLPSMFERPNPESSSSQPIFRQAVSQAHDTAALLAKASVASARRNQATLLTVAGALALGLGLGAVYALNPFEPMADKTQKPSPDITLLEQTRRLATASEPISEFASVAAKPAAPEQESATPLSAQSEADEQQQPAAVTPEIATPIKPPVANEVPTPKPAMRPDKPKPNLEATPAAAPKEPPRLERAKLQQRLRQGHAAMRRGDVKEARRIYLELANTGEAGAALALGQAFDPNYLISKEVNAPPDRQKALYWYQRAMAAGHSMAGPRIERLVNG